MLLAEALRNIGDRPEADPAELFRRMCFNALISNIDDHPRNPAVIAPGKTWVLSPTYDLTPATPVSLEHRDLALACGTMGRFANKDNLVSQAGRFLLQREDAASIVNTMAQQVQATWQAVASSCGVSPTDCEQIAAAFVYPGFGWP